ncbi:MAG: EamA family transporter RarD [Lachnospiraceae bacterium]|nr:EamA family transporter RarD [Lachnospiraceae bacterium]
MKKKTTWGSISVAFAYACWGVLTIFWNLLGEVDSLYILAQRIIWSMVFMGIYMAVLHKWKEIAEVFKSRRELAICFVCGILITINWGVYIFAVNSGHVLDASLGYFLEPVLVGAIGMLVFRERLSKLEKITFVFSVAGLAYMIAATRTFPVLALLIAGSFAVYGAVKKTLKLTPHTSLFMETLCMTPFALLFAVYADAKGAGSIGILQGAQLLLLPACGIITSVPLLMFNRGVRQIPYYISGILMYINPTLQFLMGLFYFKEELDQNRLIAFVIIWIGVLFTVYDKLRLMRNKAEVSI